MTIYLIVICFTICIINATESKKPYDKNKLATWQLECELGIISDPECPVDGGWSAWTPWTSCQGSCDETGHRRRTRECMNPPPSKNGLPCSGTDYEMETCYLNNCSLKDFRLLVKGDPARSTGLRQLEAVPAVAERCLQIQCPFEAIEAALVTENIWQLNAEEIWNDLLCVKRNLGCPVTGQWSAWDSWSICGARCGKGLRWKQRKCDTPPPSDARLTCSGSPLQYEECEGDQCAIEEPYLEHSSTGSWTPWGSWTECSENCGMGIRRRKRLCIEKYTPHSLFTWNTNCRGQYDQVETCSKKKCNLDGGWSGWSAWGACSQTCGAGKRSRCRSCTRPSPFGKGKNCFGSRTEVGTCHLKPCEVYSHTVSFFNGDSALEYFFPKQHFTFFHFYIRFMPLSPSGTIVHRGKLNDPFIHLTLHKWHLCLDISGSSKCILPRFCSPNSIAPAVWHSALVTFTNNAALLRINDAQMPLKYSVSCNPELDKNVLSISVGKGFHGAVEEIIFNFIPLSMFIEKQRHSSTSSKLFPTSASNIVYDKANLDEAFVSLENDYYIRIPCFNKSEDTWHVKLTLNPTTGDGLIFVIYDSLIGNWILLALENFRLKIKLRAGEWKPESLSSTAHQVDQWIDLSISKRKSANVIEAAINGRERLHIFLNNVQFQKRDGNNRRQTYVNDSSVGIDNICGDIDDKYATVLPNSIHDIKCRDEFYVGDIPFYIKNNISEDIQGFSGTIASIHINGALLNLHNCNRERNVGNTVQLSSRTASLSGSYHETAWGKSNLLNLTCIYSKVLSSVKSQSYWVMLDTAISGRLSSKNVTVYDDGRILRLSLPEDKELRGFYTCRSYSNDRTRNVITYGVIGKFENNFMGPDFTTALAVFTTLSLVVFTLGWLITEGINDLRDGYGFFRDIHLTPEKEAEAVCNYIDQNIHLLGSKSAARVAKARARRKARQLTSRASFAAQEPEGLMEIDNNNYGSVIEESPSTSLLQLPDTKCLRLEPSHQVFRCEPSYVSSPRHGSNITSPLSRITSSSSIENSSRNLFSKLLLNKTRTSSKQNLGAQILHRIKNEITSNRSQLLTIKPSALVNTLSPGQRVLQKFQQLKMDDP
ncbi:unnamed protein product [Pieris macdunnoughi]|uniref:Laminin G domain-containing protein n=1 Tax=Pieris macdunnoughi TaxID=345717 RepID=A0A821LBR4_9NEOP|nr:unnamed protein product [Pieris macdunnoughi]